MLSQLHIKITIHRKNDNSVDNEQNRTEKKFYL